jgi:MEMO1 family protein
MTAIRRPAVAGQFYTDDSVALRAELAHLVRRSEAPESAIGVIAPHAGYVYSGAVAGEVYGAVEVPQAVIILGPNHHGVGASAALYPAGSWLTPLGSVPINEELAGIVARRASAVAADTGAHAFEHSLEVQVPFLQQVRPDVTIVPLCLGFSDYRSCEVLGLALAEAVREYGLPVLIVASSDMTHYESADAARAKDDLAIREVLALDPEGLLTACRRHRITMCGVIPAVVMLVAATALGATRARLVRYATSGDVTGDNRQVVAYAGFTVA